MLTPEARCDARQVFDPDASPEEKAKATGKALHLDGPHRYHGIGEGEKTGGAQCALLESSEAPSARPELDSPGLTGS